MRASGVGAGEQVLEAPGGAWSGGPGREARGRREPGGGSAPGREPEAAAAGQVGELGREGAERS